MVNRRIHDSEADYLTYCAMCRDNFASKANGLYHLLDLICGSSNGDAAQAQRARLFAASRKPRPAEDARLCANYGGKRG